MISVLISTFEERIKEVAKVLLPPRDDVQYIISHQYTDEKFCVVPAALDRKDVVVSHIEGRGVTKSRNNALRLAKGVIGLFSDDDVTYKERYIDIISQTFQDNPAMDIALFKIKTRPGDPEYKIYPDHPVEWTHQMFSVSTVEIAFRVDHIKKIGTQFDERFGAGQKLLINSDENIFIEDCIKRGSKVMFFPEYVVEHPYESTTKAIPKYDKRMNWVVGAYDCRTNGKIALIKALLGTIKYLPDLLRHKTPPFLYFYHRLSAVIYILRTNKKEKSLTAPLVE